LPTFLVYKVQHTHTHTKGKPIFFKRSSNNLLKCTYNTHSDPGYRRNLMGKYGMPTKLLSKYTFSLRRTTFAKATHTHQENWKFDYSSPKMKSTNTNFRNF